jgi:hypothetical protein
MATQPDVEVPSDLTSREQGDGDWSSGRKAPPDLIVEGEEGATDTTTATTRGQKQGGR